MTIVMRSAGNWQREVLGEPAEGELTKCEAEGQGG